MMAYATTQEEEEEVCWQSEWNFPEYGMSTLLGLALSLIVVVPMAYTIVFRLYNKTRRFEEPVPGNRAEMFATSVIWPQWTLRALVIQAKMVDTARTREAQTQCQSPGCTCPGLPCVCAGHRHNGIVGGPAVQDPGPIGGRALESPSSLQAMSIFWRAWSDTCHNVLDVARAVLTVNLATLTWAVTYLSAKEEAEARCWTQTWRWPITLTYLAFVFHGISYTIATLGVFAINAVTAPEKCLDVVKKFGFYAVPLMESTMCWGCWLWVAAVVNFVAMYVPEDELTYVFIVNAIAFWVVMGSLLLVMHVGVGMCFPTPPQEHAHVP